MRQAFHIFKKDASYLRWELGVLLALLGMFVYAQTRQQQVFSYRASIFGVLLECLWAFLCARLIQAETIPGDRQFWITRPYEWRSLVGAKLLFVLVFISIPLLIADAVILAKTGFSIAANMQGLVWSVFLITAGFLLTCCAFATLMRSLTQWVLSAIVIAAAAVGLTAVGLESTWGGMEWMRNDGEIAILFIAASAVLLWQYKHRRTVLSIAVMAAGLIAALLYAVYGPSAAAFELETRFSKPKVDPSPIKMAFRARTERASQHSEQYRGLGSSEVIPLAIPVEVSGLGPGLDVISDRIHTIIELESGETWSPAESVADHHLEHWSSGYRMALDVDRAVYEKAKDHAVRIRSTLYLTLLGRSSRAVQLEIRPVHVPGVGLCSVYQEGRFPATRCVSPMRAPSNLLVVNLGPGGQDRFFPGPSYSPFPADSSISPLHWYWHPAGGRPLITLEPLAHFRRDLDLRDVSLADYQAVVPRYF